MIFDYMQTREKRDRHDGVSSFVNDILKAEQDVSNHD